MVLKYSLKLSNDSVHYYFIIQLTVCLWLPHCSVPLLTDGFWQLLIGCEKFPPLLVIGCWKLPLELVCWLLKWFTAGEFREVWTTEGCVTAEELCDEAGALEKLDCCGFDVWGNCERPGNWVVRVGPPDWGTCAKLIGWKDCELDGWGARVIIGGEATLIWP